MKGSKSEFARHRGVSPAMVTKWRKQGRLVMDGDAVQFEASDEALAKSMHPIHGGHRNFGPQISGGAPAGPVNGDQAQGGARPVGRPEGANAGGFIAAKQRQTDATADLLELKLRKERGEVHDTNACKGAIAAALAGPLQKLDSLFVRIAPALAAENDVRRIQNLGEDEVIRIRQEIADVLEAMAASGPATKQ